MRLTPILLLAWISLGTAAEQALPPVARFPVQRGPLTISRGVDPQKPFTVAGPSGGIFGQQDGCFEAWLFPVKVLSRFAITALLQDYPVPIDLAAYAAEIEVAPAVTTITYSHAAFTVRQYVFAPRSGDAGVLTFFEIASVRPLELTFRFTPEMQRMWPAPNFGRPTGEWVKVADSGYYVLHTDNPKFTAAVAMPRASPGTLVPYQERPQTRPLELKLKFDPKRDSGLVFPLLLMMGGDRPEYERRLRVLDAAVPNLFAETEEYWDRFIETHLAAETPDPQFDRALAWAEVAIEQGRVNFHGETGLVAGYYSSGDSARPGFGWFFGRDSLWSSYAINSYGDFALTRALLEFLIRRQRTDGKIMHEFSQTADLVDWKATPYFYAAADATPLLVMAVEDYVNTSGDMAFLKSHWDAIRRAYAFTRAHDSDGDGIYDNSAGTGWVESWPPIMPHQEIYLAALDQQSADAVSRLAAVMGDDVLQESSRKQAIAIRAAIEAEYFGRRTRFYAFSRGRRGKLDRTRTIYPSVAWWTGRLQLRDAESMLESWSSAEFSTDWGTRDVSDRTPFYDPISYHQGSVWPLFTGWVAMAEYRTGQPLAGYTHLMQNAELTWAQDPGAVTELLSGQFFQPLGRSSSHQVWSSAMVITPALRGLFGLEWDAPHRTLHTAPVLPASWDRARLRRVPLGESPADLEYARENGRLVLHAKSKSPFTVCLESQCRGPGTEAEVSVPLPAIEIEVPHGLPLPGAATAGLKVLFEERGSRRYRVEFAALSGTSYELPVRLNQAGVKVTAGAELAGDRLRLRFPKGEGYARLSVRFDW